MGRSGGHNHNPFYKMNIPTWLSLFLVGVITLSTPAQSSEARVVCYYTNWSVYRPGTAKFNPQNINPYLCTHLIYAFGGFTKDNTLKPFDKYQDIEKGGYAKFTGLKTYNKNLKTLLAIGGWNEASSRFSPMVASRERRKEFVRNAIKFLRQNRFDGLDLDWEYPAFREGGKPKDRENYAKLVRELREEFDREAEKTGRPRLLLTMAVPAGIEYIEKGFDVKTLNQYLDWMNLLTYDYHSAFEPAVNHHAPLYPLEEPNEYSVDSELNIDYTIKFYLEAGADRDKLVLGIPTYGRSYTLFNADAVEIGSPADGPGDQGDATREKGYLAYYEICEALKPKDKKRSTDEDSEEYSDEEEEEWTVMQPNPNAMGPVAYRGNQWVGYDDTDIVRKKAEYVAENGLGGIMFWSIDNDDFRGNCHGKPYPLIEAAKESYLAKLGSGTKLITSTERSKPSRLSSSSKRRNRPKSTTSTTTEKSTAAAKSNKRKSGVTSTTPAWNITPEPPTTPDPGSDFKCVDEGFFPHPRDCKKYFWCLDSGPSNLGIVAHQFTCPSGLFFNKAADSCDFARNVLCKMPAATTKAPATRAPATTRTTTVSTTTTTRKPVRLSTKNSVLFRSTTTTSTTSEPESEEEYEEEVAQAFEEDAEDPKVIKELIDLIKKVGGVEQLEKQLHLSETSVTNGGSTTTPSPFHKKLYQKVLERTRGKNKYTGKSFSQESAGQNSRRGPQNLGLEPTEDKEKLLKKDRPQYTTINRQRSSTAAPAPVSEEEEDEPEPAPSPQLSRARAVGSEADSTTTKPLQYVNIRRARPTQDTADDSASRNALFERAESYVTVSEPNSLDIVSGRRENIPEYVTIRRQRPTTEETTTVASKTEEPKESNESVELQETALEREISSQPQYTSIVRTRAPPAPTNNDPPQSPVTTAAPEEPSTPEPTTVLAVQISSLLNSPSSEPEEPVPNTTVIQTTEPEPTTTITSTTTTTSAPSTTRRITLRRRGTTTTTTPSSVASSSTQTPRRQFIRRTKPTSSPETTTESEPTTDTDTKKFQRGPSKFKSRKEQASQKDVASQTAESRNTSRPFSNTGARRSERPITRNFARRRPEGNVSTSTSSSSPATVTRRPFRVASRRRPSSSTTAATTTTTAGTTTLVLESDELLQDIGDIDAIEDPTLEPRAPKKTPKIQRRPLVNLKEDKTVDQNPSATNEDTKRQSKKYSSSFRQNQLDGLLKKDSTTEGTTVEDYNAETALAIATHQLITAPIPITTDYDETPRKPTTRTIDNTKTTDYTYTTPDFQATRTYDITKETTDIDTGKVTFEATYVPTNEFTDFTTPRIPSTFFTTPDGYTGIQRGISTTPGVIGYTGIQRGTPSSIEVTGYTGIQRGITASTPEVTGYTGTQRGITASTPEVTGYTGIQRGTTASAPEVTGYTGTQRGNTAFTPEVTGYTGTQRGNTAFTPEVTGYTGTQRGNTAFTTEVTGYTGTQRGNTAFTTEVTGYTGIQRGTPRTKVATPEVTGYTGIQRGGVKYSEHVTDPSPTLGFPKTSPISQDPNYLTREYLLASPVTKTYDDEYQYLSPTTTQMPRKVFRKKIQRRISTTQRPTTPIYVPKVTTPRNYLPEDTSGRSTLADRTSATYLPEVTSTRAYLPEGTSTRTYLPEVTSQRNYVPDVTGRGYVPELNRKAYVSEGTARNYVPEVTSTRNYLPEVSSVRNYLPEATSKAPKPFEKVNGKTYKPVVSYDYYDDSAERVALKYAEGTKVILHGKGSIECLDVGNFPHPSSCKKFISCARMEFGSLLGWEYICPKGLSFDPVGGICNWSAGLGCDEKDV